MYISDSTFFLNKANPNYELINEYLTANLAFSGYNNYLNAIYSWFDVSFENVVYWNGTITNTDIAPPVHHSNPGQNLTIEIYDSDNNLIDSFNQLTDNEGNLILDYSYLDVGNYTIKISHDDDDYYTGFNESFDVTIGEFAKLERILHFASENSTINLTQNYTYSIGYDTIDSLHIRYSNLTINGNGYTINPLNQSFGIFMSHLNDITIHDCNFEGEIYLNGMEITGFDIINCTFTNVSTAIECQFSKDIHIVGCDFCNNSPEGNVALCKLQQNENIIIEDCNFTNNHAYFGSVNLIDIMKP